MRKIIFLDIDGVLNCQEGFKNGHCKYVGSDRESRYQQFYPPSKNLINILIEETNSNVVISSTWRLSGLERMRYIWQQEGMSGEIIGVTPTSGHGFRGLEIDEWLDGTGFHQIFWSKERQLEYMMKGDIDNFIIIDDDSDMTYNQRHHFIHVEPSPRNLIGFNKKHYKKALKILNKSITDLYYE